MQVGRRYDGENRDFYNVRHCKMEKKGWNRNNDEHKAEPLGRLGAYEILEKSNPSMNEVNKEIEG